MVHLTKGISILQTQWDNALMAKNPDLFIKLMARHLWTPRGLTLRCLKQSADLKLAAQGDIRKPMTPEKISIFPGK